MPLVFSNSWISCIFCLYDHAHCCWTNSKHYDNKHSILYTVHLWRYFICVNLYSKHCTGSTPLRHLVYRVLELPASMKPLVYDYGGLNADTEEVYIKRIVDNHVSNDNICNVYGVVQWTSSLLYVIVLALRIRNLKFFNMPFNYLYP